MLDSIRIINRIKSKVFSILNHDLKLTPSKKTGTAKAAAEIIKTGRINSSGDCFLIKILNKFDPAITATI